jgi:FtsH-binding integral membrane protein
MERTIERSRADFVSKVMGKMGVGLLITFVVAFFTYNSEFMLQLIFGSRFVFFGLMIAEVGLVMYISRRISHMSFAQARMWFYLYAALNGVTFSAIFIAYEIASIYIVFIVAAVMFLAAGLFGITVKKDLSAMGHFLFLLLIGIIVASIVNIFLASSAMDMLISIIGVIIFSGLTAYDLQRIKAMHYNAYYQDQETVNKYSITGALVLYLDFINLFLYLLRLLGKKK